MEWYAFTLRIATKKSLQLNWMRMISKELINKDLDLRQQNANQVRDSTTMLVQLFILEMGDYKTMLIHRYILDAPKGVDVDHLNHDTLDNRKCNIVLKNRSNNAKNRLGANKNTTSGVRNVHWNTKEQKWVVQLQVNGKNKRFGSFTKDRLDEASKLAEKLRKEIYGAI